MNLLCIYFPPSLAKELSDVEGSKPEVWQSENEKQKQVTRAKNKIRGSANLESLLTVLGGKKAQRPLKRQGEGDRGGGGGEKFTWSK